MGWLMRMVDLLLRRPTARAALSPASVPMRFNHVTRRDERRRGPSARRGLMAAQAARAISS